VGLDQAQVFQRFRRYSLAHPYDFEREVAIAEAVDSGGWLPSTFMLLQPASWHPEVWTDVARMRTMNMLQVAAAREPHLCPLQFDIADRAIRQFSMEGDEVYDPFVGVGTAVVRAVKLGRRGRGCELNARYFDDAVYYARAEERKASMPTLFSFEEEPA
jgi:hypothetical protein